MTGTIRSGVINNGSDLDHRADQSRFTLAVTKNPGGVPGATVRVEDCSTGWFALPSGHFEGIHNEFRAQMVPKGAADNRAEVCVNDGSARNPPVRGSKLGDVAKPHPVQNRGAKSAFHAVVMRSGEGLPTTTFALMVHTKKARRTLPVPG